MLRSSHAPAQPALLARPAGDIPTEIPRLGEYVAAGIAFLIVAMPLARIPLGSYPINILDPLIALGWGIFVFPRAQALPYWKHRPVPVLTLAFAFFLVVSTVRSILVLGILIEPLYYLVRLSLGISLAFLIPSLVRTDRALKLVIMGILAGLCVTTALATLYSVPGFGFIRMLVLVPTPFYPGRLALDAMEISDLATGLRGETFVGGPNVTGCWLVVFWPLALAAWRRKLFGRFWTFVAVVLIVTAPLGALLTYSRSTVLALVGVIGLIIIFGFFRMRGFMLSLTLAATLLITTVGLTSESETFNFDLVIEKFYLLAEDPTQNYSDRARILTYTELFPFLQENPLYFVTGTGYGGRKAAKRGAIDADDVILRLTQGEIHAVIAASTYTTGFLSAVIYSLLMLIIGLRVATSALRSRGPYVWLSQAMFLALFALIPFWLVTHIHTTSMQGIGMAFFLVGLAFTAQQFDPIPEKQSVLSVRQLIARVHRGRPLQPRLES